MFRKLLKRLPLKGLKGLSLAMVIWGGLMGSVAAQVSGLPGKIAYFKNQTELHVTDPDGNNNRVIFTNPVPFSPFLSGLIDWRPDGGELAFASGHELMSSVYYDDIWAVKPDGSDLRRVTNAPKQSDLFSMPKGSVTVTVSNSVLNTSNIFFLYIDGADSAYQFVLNPGFQVDITLANVSDFGSTLQRIAVFNESKAWLHASGVDVQAGGQVAASGGINITPSGGAYFSGDKPQWRHDGSQIAYVLGGSIPQVIDANPPLLSVGGDIFAPGFIYVSQWDWSPVSDDFLIKDYFGSGIWKIDGGSNNATQLVPADTGNIYDLEWLRDGSGFVFSMSNSLNTFANIYHYNLSGGQITPLTDFRDVYATDPTVSPDGQWIAYTKEIPGNPVQFEIWVQKTDGSQSWRLASEAAFPAWSPGISTGLGDNGTVQLPDNFSLAQNYPNPFNPETHITFSLRESAPVDLKIYDSLGQEVRTLYSGTPPAGEHRVRWDGRDNRGAMVSAGVYLYTLRSGGRQTSRKMLLVK